MNSQELLCRKQLKKANKEIVKKRKQTTQTGVLLSKTNNFDQKHWFYQAKLIICEKGEKPSTKIQETKQKQTTI